MWFALAALLALLVAGCGGAKDDQADLENGKRLYTGVLAKGQQKPTPSYQSCLSCHTLSRANAKSSTGPNLDEAFATAKADGMTERTVQGVVLDQILHPRRSSVMPAGIVTGDDARDVAAYVASVAGEPGKDQGQLASIGTVRNTKPIPAKDGVLTIAADPTGQLAFASTMAISPAGEVTIRMPNASSTPHDIGIKGGPKGAVVANGGVSEIKFKVVPGKKYAYYCSVGTHEQDGMRGTLTVK